MSLQTPPNPIPPSSNQGHAPDTVPADLIPQKGFSSVLKNPNFRALWIGQIFSQIADRIIFVVFIALIVNYFGDNDRYNSYLYVAFTIPAILLTAIAGVFVDRWPRRMVLVSTNILRALLVGLLPLAGIAGTQWSIFALAFMISCATQFFVPAEAATIPDIVSKDNLMSANSLFTTTMMASVIFGFALGDPLINIFGLDNVHWAIAALFILASISLLFVQVDTSVSMKETESKINSPEKGKRTVQQGLSEFFDEMKDGLDYIREHAMVRNAMIKLAVLFTAVVSVCILFISFAKTYLFEDPEVASRKFAYIVTFSGVGMALGALITARFFTQTKRGYLVFTGFLILGGCLSLLGMVELVPNTSLLSTSTSRLGFIYLDAIGMTMRMIYTYTLASVMGIGAAMIAIPLQSLLHELIPEDKRGKVMGVQFTMLSTSSTVPVLIAGLAVEAVGVQFMLLLFGLPLTIFGLIGLLKRSQQQGLQPANW